MPAGCDRRRVVSTDWGELARAVRSVEDGRCVAGALELVEPGRTGNQNDPVPEFSGRLTLRRGSDHRAEEGGLADRDHGSADVHTDAADALGVTGAQRLVVGV